MKRFMLTTATAALIPVAALAGSHSSGESMEPSGDAMTKQAEKADPMAKDSDMAKADTAVNTGLMSPVKASVVIGAPIYTLSATAEADWDANAIYDEVSEDWTRIGSVDDFMIDESGKVSGLVAEVGGFLGMGDKFVLLPLDQTRMMTIDQMEYAVVTPFTTDRLTDMERVQ